MVTCHILTTCTQGQVAGHTMLVRGHIQVLRYLTCDDAQASSKPTVMDTIQSGNALHVTGMSYMCHHEVE